MSQENVEIIRGGFERWTEGGRTSDAIPGELYAEDVEWDLSAYPLVDFPNRGIGRDALLSNIAEYFAGWRDYHGDVRELIDAGDDVIVVLHEAARIGRPPSAMCFRSGRCAMVWS
jgi:ketosteroid isomerase-like protein